VLQAEAGKGLTFLEFNYMLMQSYDFLVLYQKYNCKLQIGGNDQWSNIISGVDLIRRVEDGSAYGLTIALLTTSEVSKWVRHKPVPCGLTLRKYHHTTFISTGETWMTGTWKNA